jgi:hypothetical protein
MTADVMRSCGESKNDRQFCIVNFRLGPGHLAAPLFLHSSTVDNDVFRCGGGECNRLILCALFADIWLGGINLRQLFYFAGPV